MPRVETYGGPRVSRQFVRGPRASGNVPTGLGSVATAIQDVGTAVQNINNRIAITEAEEASLNFEREKNELFFNPDTGYFNSQGRDAYDQAQGISEALDQLKSKYSDGIQSNRARQLFDRSANQQITRSRVDINRHASNGLSAWELATIQARTENSLESASLYWNDQQRLQVQSAVGRQAVIDSARMQGITGEALNERLQTYDSSFAKSVIQAASANSAISGKQAMDRFGGRLEGPDRLKMEGLIAQKTQQEKDRNDANQAILTAGVMVDTYDDRESIREEVNKIKDPELRKKTMSESMRQFNIKRQAQDEARAAAFETAESHIFEGGSALTYQAEDPEGWQRLSPGQKRSIESGKMVSTDWNTYSELMTLPKDKLAKVNPVDHFSKLAPAQRSSLIAAVKSANGTGSSQNRIDSQPGRTRASQTTLAVEQILGKKSKWNTEKKQQANAFYDLLDRENDYRKQQLGRELDSQEYTQMLSELTRTVTIERSLLGADFLAPDVDRTVIDIPPENLNVLSDFLRANNIPVTADNLVKAQRQAER